MVAAAADDCISTNGLSSVIRLLPLHSGDVDAGMMYGGPADVVVHEIVDSTLLGEAVLPALRDAFARGLVQPEGISVPWGATITAQLVHSPMLWARRHPGHDFLGARGERDAAACPAGGLAHSFEASAWHEHGGSLQPTEPAVSTPAEWGRVYAVSEPLKIFTFVFSAASIPPIDGRTVCLCPSRLLSAGAAKSAVVRRDQQPLHKLTCSVTAHAVVYWWTLQLVPPTMGQFETLQLNTCWDESSRRQAGLGAPREHWWQGLCVLDRPLSLLPLVRT